MSLIAFSGLLLIFSFLAGLIGALTGLGGGFIVIPTLVLIFHVNIHYAMGASLISVMATSSGTAAAFLRERFTNLRIGMFLETSAVVGAICGALLIAFVSKQLLMIIFSLVMFLSAYLTVRRKEESEHYTTSHPWAEKLKLDGEYPLKGQMKQYRVQHVPTALTIMGFAGMIAGLLGVGSGTIKVLAMDQAMRLPYKVSTTTSNFIIGITAAVSTGIYFTQGYIQPVITFPVVIGVLCGAFVGARVLSHLHTKWLRVIFAFVICFIGIDMLHSALTGAAG